MYRNLGYAIRAIEIKKLKTTAPAGLKISESKANLVHPLNSAKKPEIAWAKGFEPDNVSDNDTQGNPFVSATP